ncbi:hypothetical protein [Cytobacillus praedii]|uniref:hypothetical protein n=1 Tax=Cytobacillus praedii TaxID=1742358 RepID=UPI002E1AC004|nr:hypothetical protein [Cytobacillus praedii]
MHKSFVLKYGENPHQIARWEKGHSSMILDHPNLSLNDLRNINIGYRLLCNIKNPSALIIKHVNVVGMAVENSFSERLRIAVDTDQRAALNGLLMLNHMVTATDIEEIQQYSFDGVVATSFENCETNLRLITFRNKDKITFQKTETIGLIDGSVLVQNQFFTRIKDLADFECHRLGLNVNRKQDVLIAWNIACTVKTNCAVLVKNGRTLAVAAGHQDGMTAIEHAFYKAKHHCKNTTDLTGAVLAVDGNFPHQMPISAILEEKVAIFILPGNAPNDNEILEAFSHSSCSILFSKERCFQH